MSKCVERYHKYKDDDFDAIMLRIRNGSIKCGRYAHLVKVDKNANIDRKELFNGKHSKGK